MEMADTKLSIPYVKIYRLYNRNQDYIGETTLKVCKIESENLFFIKIKEIHATVCDSLIIIKREFKVQTTYFFYQNNQCFYALVIDKFHLKLIPQLEEFLQANCRFMDYTIAEKNQQIMDLVDLHCPYVFQNSLIQQTLKMQVLQETGKTLKSGFGMIGSLVGTGVSFTGSLISSKVAHTEDKHISENTQEKLGKFYDVKQKTGQVTKQMFNTIWNPLSKGASYVSDTVSEQVDKSNIKILEDVRDVYRGTINAGGAALSGIVEGTNKITDSTSTATREIMDKKYGKEFSSQILQENQQQAEEQFFEVDKGDVNSPD